MAAISRTFTNGDDSFTANAAADSFTLTFLAGADSLTVFAGTVGASMGDGADLITLRGGTLTVAGDAGADRFELYVGAKVTGGLDADLFNVRGGSGHMIDGGDGDDRVNFAANATTVTIHGGAGADNFLGYGYSVGGSIYGDAGADYFEGFRGGVTLRGGADNDLYRIAPTSPAAIVELAGEGIDAVQVARGASFTLPTNVENLTVQSFASVAGPATLIGNASNNSMTTSNDAETLIGLGGADHLYAKGGNDAVSGGDGDDLLDGGTGDDSLSGGAGNDTIVGRAGADVMTGGEGNDTYYVDDSGDLAIEAADQGSDTVRVAINGYALATNIEIGILIDAVATSLTGNSLDNQLYGKATPDQLSGGAGRDVLRGAGGDDKLFGETGDDSLVGGEGDDFLSGGSGLDLMSGGPGDDIYGVFELGDQVAEDPASGTDLVRVFVNGYTLPGNVEIGDLYFPSGATLNGNFGDNILYADIGDDHLNGSFGNDVIYGRDGADDVSGGYGNDQLFGEGGDDVLSGSGDNDSIDGGDGNDSIDGGIGDDSGAGGNGNDMLAGSDGNDILQGGAGVDRLEGGDGNDILTGGSGIDTLIGGAGDDTYFCETKQDVIDELSGSGIDTLHFTANIGSPYDLRDGMENLVLDVFQGSGSLVYDFSGSDGANVMSGSGGTDRLHGGQGNDTLIGNAGDDLLFGDRGIDTLTGGGGADQFYYDIPLAAPPGATRDTITDFECGTDIIDLHFMDANSNAAGDQAFTYTGTTSNGNAGDLWVFKTGGIGSIGNYIVAGDVNGDGAADFEIFVHESVTGTIDFVL